MGDILPSVDPRSKSPPDSQQAVPSASGDPAVLARIGPAVAAFTGRAERFGRVVGEHENRLLRYVSGLIGDPDAAQDVVQEVFLKLYQQVSRSGWDAIEHMPTWLSRVAHNQAIDAARKRHREKEALKDSTQEQAAKDSAPAEKGAVEEREMQAMAVEELGKLPPDLREPLLLKVYQGLTVRQIAQVTGMSSTMVFNRTAEALKVLSQRMKERGAG